ncbi:polynucleotide 5'-hydroxyl-kinase NOL9 [Ananas comosus]|uniref:Polynucleotide 5'-hydroxyl-kinase NOL9 n=1 Tax=Ananas comosus TaxID=4615 RepID=A0A6P5GQJ6_ANACO|nr:polynucleotide 5'-hydroxyl-kinase NOL9 [Ananas comosus]XP_020108252.1 polynucleotide 5'-hydroxyl-kinase NOL9 [Ananas comosus]XP_020108253.1 polynucleotide 5'-hydroxyl-kinase NOL9 [Ananas comosus]XP_020108254.1 polynucleotide 5'-hydroxyl-kinase NOL9 [Ananas comosus]
MIESDEMVGASKNGMGTSSPHVEILIPPWWAEAAEAIARAASQPPVAFICGPKNSGKSTFSRYLLNILLERYKRVGYLDTDVGQPEFSPPGCLSLHIIGENILDLMNTSLKTPERCFFYGDISSKRDPEAYLNYVFNLYDYFLKEYCSYNETENTGNSMPPLIINTPGWMKGTGFDLLVEMLRYISPTMVVKLCISTRSKNLPNGMFWFDGEQKGQTVVIDVFSAQQDSLNRSVLIQKDVRGLRDRRLFEYFKQCFPTDTNISTNKELAYALASLPPYILPFSKVKVMHLHCQVPSNEIWHSLNATIVGLAVSTDGTVMSRSTPWCVGLGIVRGVDVTEGLLYVITPVPLHYLRSVDLLLQGFVEVPTSLLQVRGCVSPYMSTNVLHRISDKDL